MGSPGSYKKTRRNKQVPQTLKRIRLGSVFADVGRFSVLISQISKKKNLGLTKEFSKITRETSGKAEL